MTFLDDLGVIDIRSRLPHRDWIIGTRQATTSLTWHYNGPAVAAAHQAGDGLIAQLIGDANWQMRAGWGGTKNGAPGLMYHLVIGHDGRIYLCRDIAEILWHCAHEDGNSHGLSLHFAIGEGQQPSVAQLASGFRVSEALRQRYGIPMSRVLGHLEWKHATLCPGPFLMQHLVAYRAGITPRIVATPTPAGLRRWQVNALYTDPVRVHQAPAIASPVSTRLKPGTIVFVDVVKRSETPDSAHPTWVHMAAVGNEQADAGFLAEDCGVWL